MRLPEDWVLPSATSRSTVSIGLGDARWSRQRRERVSAVHKLLIGGAPPGTTISQRLVGHVKNISMCRTGMPK